MEGFPKHAFLQACAARDSAPDALKRFAKPTLAEAGELVGGCPPEIRVGEEQGGLGVLLVAVVGETRVTVKRREGAEVAGMGEEEVEEDLGVEGPVAGVVEDEDGVDFEVGVGRVVNTGGEVG